MNDFLYFKEFAVRVVQLNLLQHVLALLGNERLELLANRFQMIWFLLIKFVQ